MNELVTVMKKVKALLLEDNKEDAEAIQRLIRIQNLNYDLTVVSTCREAKKCLDEKNYDVVLLDSHVPDDSGLSLLPDLKDVPAIIITGQGDEEAAVMAMKNGASDYLVKDLAGMYLHLLPAVIEETINKQRLRQEKERAEMEREKVLLDLEKANRELEALSRTDSLTKLSNRRDIKYKIDYEISRFERSRETFSILLADIDHFRDIFSKFGTSGGDLIIAQVAERLVEKCRKIDTIGRWGEEAFMIIVPETNLSGAATIAENLRAIFDTEKFFINDELVKISMSFGVVAYTINQSVNEFTDMVETLLLKAKNGGGNKVVSFSVPKN